MLKNRTQRSACLLVSLTFAVLLAATTPALAVEGVGRFGGADRFQTAILGSQNQWPDDSTNSVVIANAYSFADSLSASALCGELAAPLLLTAWGSLPDGVIEEISRVTPFDAEVGHVVLIGGTDVIGPEVKVQLSDAGFEVSRIGGTDRYATSALIAERLRTAQDDQWTGNVWLARGDRFPDGLSVSPYAYQNRRPVLLTRPDALPAPIASFMDEHVEWAGVVGGPEAISSAVVIERNDMGIGGPRIGGSDRYKTATELARYALTAEGIPASADWIGIATGLDFPDALAGGVVTGQAGGVLLLTQYGSTPQATLDFAAEHQNPNEAFVFGGYLAVSEASRAQLGAVLYP